MPMLTESTLEETALDWTKDLSYAIAFGCNIASRGTVASLQDSLLSKLMRGKVRVKDVED